MRGGYNDADFLIGAFNSIEGAVDLAKGDFRGTELAFYLDDTYKVTPNLTVTLGLRWEFATPVLVIRTPHATRDPSRPASACGPCP